MNGIKVENLTEKELDELSDKIGNAFAYDNTGEIDGNILFPTKEAYQKCIKATAIACYKSGILYATSDHYEGVVAIEYKGHEMKLFPSIELVFSMLKALGISGMKYYIKQSTASKDIPYEDTFKKKKIPYIHLGMLAVLEPYQNKGYMRKCMDIVYKIADQEKLDVVWDTDAKIKADKYIHLGATLVSKRNYTSGLVMYELCRKCK